MPGFIGLTVYLFKHMIAYHQIISFALTRLFPLTLMATYTTSSSLSWRNDKTGDLPLSKYGLIGTVQLLTTSSMLVVACMTTMSFTILFWDPVQELWTKARDPDVPWPRCCGRSNFPYKLHSKEWQWSKISFIKEAIQVILVIQAIQEIHIIHR